MNRPIYESDKNRADEKRAAKAIATVMQCNIIRNKPLYFADYSLIKDNKIKAIGEIKRRNNSRLKYPTYMISAEKISKCLGFANGMQIPFFLFVWWDEGIFLGDIQKLKPCYLDIGGRTDRGDKQDVEPMVHYDPNDFKLMVTQELI